MADKNYKLTFAMSDGTSKDVQFTAPQGPTGATGSRGTGILKVTTAPSSYTTATGGFTPTYRIALSTVKSQSGASAVLVGDTIMYSYYHYPVGYVDASYVYLGARVSIRGATGAAGATGETGPAGYTPVKGTDYFTAADQESIVQQVVAALGTPVFGRVDADNNIILTGELAGGTTYTVKYEDADGNVQVIGTINQSSAAYTNLADPASADWKENYRINSSGALVTTPVYGAGGATTNFIPCKSGDVIRVKGMGIGNYYADANGTKSRSTAYFYAEDKSTIIAKNVPADGNGWVLADDVWTYTVGTSLTAVSGDNSEIRYARLTGFYYDGYTADNVIITVNEEIV